MINPTRRSTVNNVHGHYSLRNFRQGSGLDACPPTIRFCAGSTNQPSSTVCRLWAHKRDVYLGARMILEAYKISLHESGQWISAFTSRSAARAGRRTAVP